MKHLSILFLLLCSQLLLAQNLVPNHSFERHFACPPNTAYFFEAMDWGFNGTVNYFHECGDFLTFLPGAYPSNGIDTNFMGSQTPHSGKAYGGFWNSAGSITTPNSYEFLKVPLTDTLLSGQTYHVQFFFSPANIYQTFNGLNTPIGICANSICLSLGARFSDTNNLTGTQLIAGGPYKVLDSSLINTVTSHDTTIWYEFHATYIAQGGETQLYLSNLNDYNNSLFFQDPSYAVYHPSTNLPEYTSYNYIDDVYVGIASPTGCSDSTACNYNPYSQQLDSSLCSYQLDSTLSLESCEAVLFKNILYDSSGTYLQTINGSLGCDTNYTLIVNILNADTSCSISVQNDTLTAVNPNNLSLSWSTGETTQSISLLNNGSYWLASTDSDGCSDTSWINVDWLSLKKQTHNTILRPNPASSSIYVNATGLKKVYNLMGKQFISSQKYH